MSFIDFGIPGSPKGITSVGVPSVGGSVVLVAVLVAAGIVSVDASVAGLFVLF